MIVIDEGLEELESEFNSGKIMYAFVRIDDPNTNLKKFILIVWVIIFISFLCFLFFYIM